MAKATTKDRILASLRNSKDKVFLRDDFNRFGTYRQVCRVVKELSDEGKLMRLGTYVKAIARRCPCFPLSILAMPGYVANSP